MDPGYTGTCDSKAMCLEISSDSPSDQEDSGDRSDGDGRDRQGAVATASPDDDWIKSDDLDSKINELKLRAKRFLEDNAGNKDLSKQERAKSPIPATPLQINPHDYPFATPVASGDGQRLARAWQYEKTVGDLINANADTTQPQHQVMSAADASLRRADAAFQGGDRASAEFTLQLATTALDVALDGGKSAWARNTFEGLTGRNADDHSKLSYFMQAAGLVVMVGEIDATIAASAVVVPVAVGLVVVGAILTNTDLIKHDVDIVVANANDVVNMLQQGGLALDSLIALEARGVNVNDPISKPRPSYDFNDPSKPPVSSNGKEWVWSGPDVPGGKRGAWVDPDNPQVSMHPDLDHSEPKGPHWDYNDRQAQGKWAIDRDGNTVRVK